MIKKKVCLIGSFAVGKTSLASRFVKGKFSEKYLSTVGVVITQKEVQTSAGELLMVVWDLAGEDDFQALRLSFLKGASGFLFVADGTREETLQLSRQHMERTAELFPDMPSILLLNKSDLTESWEIADWHLEGLPSGLKVHFTSAKSGDGVENAFATLAEMLVGCNDTRSNPYL